MDGQGLERLRPKQRKALQALIDTGDVQKAAEAADVHRATVYNWLQSDEFAQALATHDAMAINLISSRLVAMGQDAVEAIETGLKSQDLRIKLRAADLYFGRMLAIVDAARVQSRIEEMDHELQELRAKFGN